jgi:hypothetical protein
MQDSNFLGLPKESKLSLNIQLLNYNENFGIQRNNWFFVKEIILYVHLKLRL